MSRHVSAALPEGISEEERAFIAKIQPYLTRDRINEPVDIVGNKLIHIAVLEGFNNALNLLLAVGGVDINAVVNDNGDTLLHLAAKKGETNQAALLIAKGAKLDVTNNRGWTPLYYAFFEEHPETVDLLLLSNGSNINAVVNNNSQSLLHIAVGKGNVNATAKLLAKGARLDVKDNNGATPILMIVFSYNAEVIDLLIKNGVDINAPINDKGMTLLHLAAASGNTKGAALLIEKGARVNEKDITGGTPLGSAAYYGHPEMVDLLIGHGVDINAAVDDAGHTLLDLARRRGLTASVELLIAKGAVDNTATTLSSSVLASDDLSASEAPEGISPEEKDFFEKYKHYLNPAMINQPIGNVGNRLIHLATIKGFNSTLIKLLTVEAVNINIQNTRGDTALHFAAVLGNKETASILISKDARSDLKDSEDRPPIAGALLMEHFEIFALLKANVLDINSPIRSDGATLLHLAAHKGLTDIFTSLIRDGARVDAEDKNGFTPLHVAVMGNNSDIVNILLDKGADVQVFNKSGQSALSLAAKFGNFEIFALLRDKLVDDSWNIPRKEFALREVAKIGSVEDIIGILDEGTEINSQNFEGMSALHWAAERKQTEAVALLLSRGARTDITDKYGRTPLHLAASTGNEETVALLLSSGTNPNSKDKYEKTPLHYAKDLSRTSIIDLLNQRGADDSPNPSVEYIPIGTHHESIERQSINSKIPLELLLAANLAKAQEEDNIDEIQKLLIAIDGAVGGNESTPTVSPEEVFKARIKHLMTPETVNNKLGLSDSSPIHVAAENGFNELLVSLIELGAIVDLRGQCGMTPLQHACGTGQIQAASILLSKGASIEYEDNLGNRALHLAIIHNQNESVTLLLEARAKVNVADKKGFTPLYMAVAKENTFVVKALLDKGADSTTIVSGISDGPKTAMEFAKLHKNEAIKLLLKQAITPEQREKLNKDLIACAKTWDVKKAEELIEEGAQVNISGTNVKTALHFAAINGDNFMVRLLLDNGANIDATDNTGFSAAHYAAQMGRDDVMSTLIERHADITATNKKGKTPLDIAKPSTAALIEEALEKAIAEATEHALADTAAPAEGEAAVSHEEAPLAATDSAEPTTALAGVVEGAEA